MSIILVNPPCLYNVLEFRSGSHRSYLELVKKHSGKASNWRSIPAEHLGLMSMKAFCASRGIPVHVVNGMLELHTSVPQTFAAIEAVARQEGEPELIGFSGTNLVFGENLALARQCVARWPNVRIVLGYDFATLNYQRILSDYPDIHYVCRGEGELVFAELASRALNGRSVEDVPGLAYRAAGGQERTNPAQPLVLDDLPWACRDELARTRQIGFAAAVFSTRGCPYRCSFCTTGETAALLGKQSYRLRRIESVVDEMEYLVSAHQVDFVAITDDLFVTKGRSSRERAQQFAEEILRRGLKIQFMVDARLDSIEPELFRLLRRAGLQRVFVGVETGSKDQLSVYNKHYSAGEDESTRQLRFLVDLGIQIIPGIITFHPTVSHEELRATLRMIDACGYDGMYQFINRVKVYPGTPLYDQFRAARHIGEEWPVADWQFSSLGAQALAEEVTREATRPGSTFHDVRAAFSRSLEAWENGAAAVAV